MIRDIIDLWSRGIPDSSSPHIPRFDLDILSLGTLSVEFLVCSLDCGGDQFIPLADVVLVDKVGVVFHCVSFLSSLLVEIWNGPDATPANWYGLTQEGRHTQARGYTPAHHC